MDFEDVTMEQIQSWAAQTGTQNEDEFLDFDPYELLFLGCTGSTKVESISQPGVEVVFQFEASANSTNTTIGDITGIQVDAWDYLWVLPQVSVDATTNQNVTTPLAAYVEVVYPVSAFEDLGIPDPDDGQEYNGPEYSE